VRLRAGSVNRIARVVTGDSFLSQHGHQIHFGLGDVTEVDMIDVRWPNGHVQQIRRPEINRYHHVVPDISR
jgi:hypothetical protein